MNLNSKKQNQQTMKTLSHYKQNDIKFPKPGKDVYDDNWAVIVVRKFVDIILGIIDCKDEKHPPIEIFHRIITIIGALVSLFFNTLCAQSPTVPQHLSWQAEVYSDYRISEAFLSDSNKLVTAEWNQLQVEKLLQPPHESGFITYPDGLASFGDKLLLDLLYDTSTPAFADAQLTKPLTDAARDGLLAVLDTMVKTRSDTYEEQAFVFRFSLDISHIYGMRVRQQLYWDTSSNTLGYRALAFAPLIYKLPSASGEAPYVAACWFPIAGLEPGPDAARLSADVTFINQTLSRASSADLSKVDNHKGQFDKERIHWLLRSSGYPLLMNNLLQPQLLSQADRDAIVRSVDTIVTFDPKTFEEKVMIVTNELKSEQISHLQLAVRWFWHEEKRALYYRPVGWAPMVRTDRDRQLKPLFYVPFF
jgi:hypothetical protein